MEAIPHVTIQTKTQFKCQLKRLLMEVMIIMQYFCMSSSMPCNYGTVPALRLIGIALALSALVSIRGLWKEKEQTDE